MTEPEPGCHGHLGLPAELCALAVAALDRLAPALDRLRTGPADAPGTPAACAICPVCALLAALRGERSELAVRLAEQVTGLAAVLRAALEEGDPGPRPQPPPHPPATSTRDVHRIPVVRLPPP